MTDEPAQKNGDQRGEAPGGDPAALPARARIAPADESPRFDVLPILYLVGFVVLAGTLFYLWQHPRESRLAADQANQVDTLQAQVTGLRDDVGRLSQQLGVVQSRAAVAPSAVQQLSDKVGALESRPSIAPDAVQALSDRVTALDGRRAATPEQLTLLSEQIQSLGRQIPNLQPLTQRLATLEQRPQFDPAPINGKLAELTTQLGAVSAKLDDAATKLQQLATQTQDANAKLGARLDQLASRTDDLDKQDKQTADQLRALTQKTQITARLQGMAAALAAGQKLGDIPGAPPALARFATEAPPTEAALRESFDQYATAAQRASQPAITDNQDFGARLWTRAQQSVTVRQGDRVLVGDPIAGYIAHARDKLDNGDLAGAVKALKGPPGLAGPAAQAMQPWVDQAESLVAARAAIASLAAN